MPQIRKRVVSQLLREEPELIDVIEQFVDGLSARIGELEQAYQRTDWETLRLIAHQLKGAGGSYGYRDLTELARDMELDFTTHSGERFEDWLEQLRALADAARQGLEPDEEDADG